MLYFSSVLITRIFLDVSLFFCSWLMMGMQDALECIFVAWVYMCMLAWRLLKGKMPLGF